VAFDTGTGITETTVHARDCRLVRRQIDAQRFMDYARFKASIRAGAMIALAAPLLWYTTVYWWTAGTLDGLIEAMTLSALESALELPTLILAHPTQTLIWLAAGTLATRIALGPRPHQRKRRKKP
jgi:lysozyme family protein